MCGPFGGKVGENRKLWGCLIRIRNGGAYRFRFQAKHPTPFGLGNPVVDTVNYTCPGLPSTIELDIEKEMVVVVYPRKKRIMQTSLRTVELDRGVNRLAELNNLDPARSGGLQWFGAFREADCS